MTLGIRRAPAPRGAETLALSRRLLALSVLCSAVLVVILDNTVLNVALPTIVRDLHATSSELQWIVDAYIMVFAGLLLVAGSLADRFGRKLTFLAGLLAFAAGSAWAAFSGSVSVLIAARASMGIGASLLVPSTLSIITEMFRNPVSRQRAIGVWAGTSGLAVSVGPIVGGVLLAHFWWGSVFLINVPIVALALLCAVVLVPESKNPAALRPDLMGSLLSIAGLGLVLWSIIEAPVRGWSSALVIGVGAAGLAVLAVFAAWEHASSHPMLNLRFFRSRSFSAAVLPNGTAMFAMFGALFGLTLFLQFNLAYTALQTGVRLLPAAGAIAVAAPVSPLFVRMIGTKLTTTAGMLLTGAGLWQISGASVTTAYLDTLPSMIMVGVGVALASPAATASVMGSLPREHSGIGAAANSTFNQVGGALGVAVMGSVLSTRYQDRMTAPLAPYHIPADVRHTILGSVGGALGVAAREGGILGSMLAQLARSSFISGMDIALVTGAGVAAAGGLIALLALPARPSRRDDQAGSRRDQPDLGGNGREQI